MLGETDGLRLHVLGDLIATRGGAPVGLGGRRQRAVLAVLAAARGEVVSSERLADCVWGDAAPANTSAALQSYVSHLRRGLQPEASARARDGVIARAGTGYVLRVGADTVDAWCFERSVESASSLPTDAVVRVLDDALRLWRGPAYAEYASEPWCVAEITRLEELRAAARERLLGARLALGEGALLVPELEALVAEAPFREERWRLLALALYRTHRQADALAALRRARETLADALGVDPGPALRALEQEILAQSPDLDLPADSTATVVLDAGTTVPPRPPTVDELVERDLEIAALRRIVEQVRDGTGSLVLVEGPGGIGKTRLLTEATRLAAETDVTVLAARGSHAERAYAFGVVRQLFEPRLVDPAGRASLLEGAARGAAGVFDLVTGEPPDPGEFGSVHGLYWLTVNLTEAGPLLLTVDDVQWADAASLRYLAYLTKRLEGLPVVVVLTLRTGDEHPDETLLTELALEPCTTLLRPAPLSADGVRTIVTGRVGPAAAAPFVEACHRVTSGNPLLLRQLLGALESEGVRPDVTHVDTVRAVGSRAVSDLVRLRLRRMPPDVVTTARAVAVLGRDADLPTVASLSGLADDRAAQAIDLLGRGEILRRGPSLAFVSPLVRDAVYDDLPPAERALWHERAATVLEARGVGHHRIARHLLAAPCRGREATVGILRSAAARAVTRGAFATAVALLERALHEPARDGPDRVDLQAELAFARARVDTPDAEPAQVPLKSPTPH